MVLFWNTKLLIYLVVVSCVDLDPNKFTFYVVLLGINNYWVHDYC